MGYRSFRHALSFLGKLVVLVCCVVMMTTGMVQADPALRFGLIATEDADTLRSQWQPLLDRVGQKLGQPLEAHIAKDYAGVIWAMKDGTDVLSWMGNKAAIEAVDNADVDIFARKILEGNQAGYYSLLIVRSDSSLDTLDQVLDHARDLTLGLADTNSTSGYLVPSYFIFAKRGLDPRKTFNRVIQSNHGANMQAVAEGRIDAAIVASDHLNTMTKQNPDLAKHIKIVWKSIQIPSDPLLISKALPEALRAKIRQYFTELGVAMPGKPATILAAERAQLSALGQTGFAVSDNRQLLPVREMELFRSRLVLEANESLPAAERQQKLDEIDRKLADLKRQIQTESRQQ